MGVKGKIVRLFSRNEAKRGTAPLASCANSETLKGAGIRQNEVVKENGHPEECAVPLTERASKEQWHTEFFAKFMANNGNKIDKLKEKVKQDKQFRKLKGKEKVTLLLEEVQMCCQQTEHLRLQAAEREVLLEQARTEQQETCFILGKQVSELQRENEMLAEKHEAEMIQVHDEKQKLMTSLQQIQDCRDNAEADLTAMKEKFDEKCLEADELQIVLKACQDRLTQALMTVEDECARNTDLQKAHSDLESEFAKLQRENEMLAEKHEAEMIQVHDEKQKLMTSLQQIQDCKDNAAADLTAMKEKFKEKYLEALELQLQLNACQDQLTQALMTAENECARSTDLQKAHSNLESQFTKMVSETEMLEKRLAQMKQKFSDNDQKMAHLVEVNEKQKICISDLEETLFQKQQQIQVMEESRGKAESDLTDVKENLNPRYLEVHELQLQLNAFQEQMTQALMTVEAERARSADFEKAYHDLESEFTKLVSETEMIEERSGQLKQKFADNDQKMAHLVQVNEKQKICISDLEETLFQKQQQIQVMEESRGKAESDLTDVKENLNQRCLEVHELQLQLNACHEQMTQALMTVEAKLARSADFEKAYYDLESEFAKMVIETEVFKVRSAQMKQIFDVNDKKMAHLVQVIEKQKMCSSDLEETLFQKQQQIQVMEESRGKAESDLTDVKENLNQRYLEFHELQLQLKMCQEQLTEAPMALEAEHASQAELQKQDSNMDSQLSEVEGNKDDGNPAQIKREKIQKSHHETANKGTEQQNPEECSVKGPILQHPTQFDLCQGWLTAPQLVATVHSPKAPSAEHTSLEDTNSANDSAQDSEDENSPTEVSTKQPPCTGHPTAEKPCSIQKTQFDFSPYSMKEVQLITDLFNPKKIITEEPSPEDECVSQNSPAQIITPSNGQHIKGQSRISKREKKKPEKRKNRKPKK